MRTTKLRTLVAAMLLASAPLALQAATSATTTTDIDKQATQLDTTAASKGQTQVATKIASSFTKLAGSQDNALKLVQALRSGTSVTLTSTSTGGTGTGTGTGGTTSTSFTPPTGKMGWGNVFISLALAQDQLARLGITDPTQAQLQAALMGGDVTGADGKTVTLKGILQMRADGMGWGQIAQASGTKLGPVVSSIKSAHTKVAALPSTSGSGTPTSASGTTAKSTSKGVTTAAGTSGNAGSKGLVTASGTSAGGAVTHGNSANAPGRGIVNAAGGGAANVTAVTGSGNGQGVVNAGGGNAAGVSNAGGNGKGNAGGNGKGKGGG
jgi:hypothetical protein